MKREVPCVLFWCTSHTPEELANIIQTARGRNGYGVAWVSFFSAAATRFKLPRAGAYRTVDGRTFKYLAPTLGDAHKKYGRTIPRRVPKATIAAFKKVQAQYGRKRPNG